MSSAKSCPFSLGLNVILERVMRLVVVLPMAITVLGLDALRVARLTVWNIMGDKWHPWVSPVSTHVIGMINNILQAKFPNFYSGNNFCILIHC